MLAEDAVHEGIVAPAFTPSSQTLIEYLGQHTGHSMAKDAVGIAVVDALNKLAGLVDKIITSPEDNVIAMAAGGRKRS